jgi:hypothetical protein
MAHWGGWGGAVAPKEKKEKYTMTVLPEIKIKICQRHKSLLISYGVLNYGRIKP